MKLNTPTFSEQVYEIVASLPEGRVMTYKQIAYLLNTQAYRAVGTALNKNPYPISQVPCHRVIKSNRELGGYAGDINRKYELLENEGIEFEENSRDLFVQRRVVKSTFLLN